MRVGCASVALALPLALGPLPALAAPAESTPETGVPASPDLESLRRQWHRCVRQAYSGQPVSVPKQAAQNAALAECKPAEDAYVAGVLAAQGSEGASAHDGHSLTSRARAWMASVAAYVVDPVTAWLGGLTR
ncbi:hypothetical protein [Methylobacterium organophilum]|uniref:Secreted protein n=1 Tax=Methylobacterium organophilum TaxID=410 RepID=A0ABQ4T9S1_METOR|nr:hypothetical protein [Methylobacterium organophilum]GJE27332.1 hypothetical protein LKMONMHP_2190 [Methylobacterium organophilum]